VLVLRPRVAGLADAGARLMSEGRWWLAAALTWWLLAWIVWRVSRYSAAWP